jgi:hypothetical protein
MLPAPTNPFVLFVLRLCLLLVSTFLLLWPSLLTYSQENPYIVAYDHNLEEPGSLEVEYFSTFGTQRGGPDFHANWVELEYGATAWWTTELYLSGQTTFGDSTVFTGYRWENRFRPLEYEHLINPVLYTLVLYRRRVFTKVRSWARCSARVR